MMTALQRRAFQRASARDPDDDHVLACALAARAELIVTGDLDLLTLNTYQNIPIVSAAEAMRRVEAQK
jgi:predicted nucleic acid-binding protein